MTNIGKLSTALIGSALLVATGAVAQTTGSSTGTGQTGLDKLLLPR